MRSVARWMALSGVGRVAMKRWAADGDPQARLIADPTVRVDPYPLYEQIRERGELTPGRIGYITASHAIASSVLRSDEFRTTSVSAVVPPPLRIVERLTRTGALHPLETPSLLATDPPAHTRYRGLVASVFTHRAVGAMRADVQAIADQLLDDLEREGGDTVDLVDRYCSRLPVAVISDILGIAPAERDRVLGYGDHVAPSLDFGLSYRQFRDVERGLAAFDRWLGQHMRKLRRNPGDDLMSRLIGAEVDGERLTDEELRATAGLVLAAGFETTVNLLSSGVRLLVDHPDQLAILQAEPDGWGNAVDEILRYESPVQVTGRVTNHELELAGRTVGADSFVSLVLGAANRDPAVFTDPNVFDVRRGNANKHLSFSAGRHFCVGAALARLEGEIGLRSLFERFPELGGAGEGDRRQTRVLRGWATLPIRLGPPARATAAG